ncbi:glyoxalase/bleomycin resistance/extradiol dioxygenase family protein [Ahniella affigens]|uniref:Glyoxalase/bleomycin resistance/extradiol dioxygenase family protein n=1 Tax=Ahniella affigens TaxID=2021234 RepID=A0A2P1PUF9_9GAMM|nr:VOC family protein [Ahniella affigens]AVP98471.1 glyoxalase/bleomycin resistance/extradiol dioxygenase family protein [Ahniella affigens]
MPLPLDQAIPILPSRVIAETVTFYQRLGFAGGAHDFDANYALLCRGDIELHFFAHPNLRPEQSDAGCYLRVQDARAWYQAFQRANLPNQGIPRLDALSAKPWGMLEFALVDSDGNLIRVGQVLDPE